MVKMTNNIYIELVCIKIDKMAAIVFSNQIQENNICFQHFCTMCNLFFVNMS